MILVQVAGPPDTLGDQLEQRARRVVDEHGFDCHIERVSDFEAIVALQVFAIPGLLVDSVLKSVGRVPEIAELVLWLDSADGRIAGRFSRERFDNGR